MRRRRFRLFSEPSPSLLVQSCDDIEVFAVFYETHYDAILGFLARRVFDPEIAFDLVSETFAKALERRRQFRGDSVEQERAWLYAIARTELSHYWRSGKTERAAVQRLAIVVPTLTEAETDRIEASLGLAGASAELTEALSTLPVDQRVAVELRIIREHSYAEVAEELDISEPTARARVSRGLRALGRELEASGISELIGDLA